MKWISVKKQKPETDLMVYGCNRKYSVASAWICLYQKRHDGFVLFDPEIRNHPPIELTHWIELPLVPIEDEVQPEPDIEIPVEPITQDQYNDLMYELHNHEDICRSIQKHFRTESLVTLPKNQYQPVLKKIRSLKKALEQVKS